MMKEDKFNKSPDTVPNADARTLEDIKTDLGILLEEAQGDKKRSKDLSHSIIVEPLLKVPVYYVSISLNLHALRTHDWDSFKASLQMMMPWLQIYDNDKYSKWLVEFWLGIRSLPEEKEIYMRDGLFAKSMTGKSSLLLFTLGSLN